MQLIIPGNKPLVGFDFTKQVLDPEFGWADGGADTRATTRTVERGGTIYTVAIDTPAYGDDGLSIEPAATNLLTYSEQFDNAAWVKAVVALTANIIVAPDGSSTASKLVADTTNTQHAVYRWIDAGTYTFSLFVKDSGDGWVRIGTGAYYSWFNVTDGIIGTTQPGTTATITSIGNGWFRCSVSFTTIADNAYAFTASGDTITAYAGDGTSGIYIWGAQLEEGTVPTAYIPTTSSTVSRAADAVSWSLPQALKDILSVEEPTPTSAYDETNGAVVLSTVDGTAFVMPDDGSGADLSPYAGTHVIKVVDSAGKVAWGYLSDAGTGETLGSELVTNGGFDTDTTGWGGYQSTQSVVAGGQSGNAGKCVADAGSSGNATFRWDTVFPTIGTLYKSEFYAQRGDATSNRVGFSTLSYGLPNTKYLSITDTDWSTKHTLYATRPSGTEWFFLANLPTELVYVLLDTVSVKQVTAPPATGCWIVSTPGGSTKNWAYIESGFSPNDIASYDLYPVSQWRAEGTLVVRGIVFGFAGTDLPNYTDVAIISSTNSGNSVLRGRRNGDGSLRVYAYDGTTNAAVDLSWAADTSYDLALRWSAATGLMQVGYKLSIASTWTWGTAAAFDGAFALGSNLNIGYSPNYPFEIGKVQFHDRWLNDGSL
jgi:hypothetical protein